jgi:hypothetical protein
MPYPGVDIFSGKPCTQAIEGHEDGLIRGSRPLSKRP